MVEESGQSAVRLLLMLFPLAASKTTSRRLPLDSYRSSLDEVLLKRR